MFAQFSHTTKAAVLRCDFSSGAFRKGTENGQATNIAEQGPSLKGEILDGEGVRIKAASLQLEHDFAPGSDFFRHGWNSWSATNWWHLNREPWRVWNNPARTNTAEDAATDTALGHRSYMVTALREGEACLLVGALSRYSTVLDVDAQTVSARPLEGEAEVEWFLAFGTERECWQAYVRALRQCLQISKKRRAEPIWNSWYSWFEEISEEIIGSEIRPAARLGYKVLEIDDGWEDAVGNWWPNAKFSSGMADLAVKISAQGMAPGIWVAPFIAMADSEVARKHPEYFIHDGSGVPIEVGYNWGQGYFGLDTTHPGARQWLRGVISRLYGWGYRYFKLDFIYAAAYAGRRYKDVPREQAYRQGLQLIRQAAPDAYLLGSGAVIAPSLGLLDGIRVGPDTAPYWDNTERHKDPTGPGVRNALRTSLNRVWLKDFVDLDPDVALVRTHGSLLSPEVNEVTVQAARVCGVFNCSDPASWLTSEQCEYIRSVNAEFAEGKIEVEQIGRYTFRIGGAGNNGGGVAARGSLAGGESQVVDFTPCINPTGRMSDRLLVK